MYIRRWVEVVIIALFMSFCIAMSFFALLVMLFNGNG